MAAALGRLPHLSHPGSHFTRTMPPFLSALLFVIHLVLLPLASCAAVTVLANSVSAVDYGFPNALSQYELSNADVVIDIPLGTSATNIAALLAGEVDFVIVSGPLTPAQAAASPNITALPIAASAIVPVYRLDALNASTSLTFSGRTLALVYAGNITQWDDACIAAENPGVALPSQNITVVFFNASRHFNYILLTALNKFEPSIATVLPPSEQPDWPTGRYAAYIGLTSSTGTSAEVVDADGALTIDTQNYAVYFQATIGDMYNRRGNAVTAGGLSLFYTVAELLAATATNATSFADMTDCVTAKCWPIASPAYVLVDTYASPRGCEVRSAVVDFLRWYYQQTAIVERVLSDYGLQSLSDEMQQPFDVPAVLASVTCWGQPMQTVSVQDVYSIAGVDRLLPLMNMVVDLHAIVDSSVDFEYHAMTSTAAMLTGWSTLQLAVLYEAEINTTATPIDYERYVLLPSFLTSVIITFNTQLSPTVTLNASELIVDIRTLALILLGSITDWSDPRLVALNPVLATQLDGRPAPVRLIHGCATLDSATTSAPLLTYIYSFLFAAVSTDPAVDAYVSSPAGVEAIEILEACVQPATTSRLSDWLYVLNDVTIATLVSDRPGSIGYALDDGTESGVSAAVGTFAIVMAAEVDGRPGDTVRRSTPAALAACAAAGQLNDATLTLDLTAAWSNADCWPLTQVVYMQIPRDYPADSYAMGVASITLLQWVYSSDALDVWCKQNMLIRTAAQPTLQSALLSALDTITSGGSTVLTLPYVWQLTSAILYSAHAIFALGWLVTAGFIVVTVRYRNHALLRSASPPFMLVSLAGVLLLFGAIFALVSSPSSASCIAFSWLIQLGFTITFTPLFAKAYRIYRIFGRRKLRVVKISNRRLLAAVAVTILLDVVYLSIWHSVAPPSVTTTTQLTTSATGVVQPNDYPQCAWDGSSAGFMGVECAIKVVSLCVGVMLAFSTRQVTDRFNDSKSISLSIYNLVFALGVILPILVLVDAVGDVRVLLLLFCLVEIGFATLAVLFLPKLFSFIASNHVAPLPSQSVYQPSQSSYSFLSFEQLISLPHLSSYIAALMRHLDEAKRVQASRKGSKSLALAGPQSSVSGQSESPADTSRRPREVAAVRVDTDSRKKGTWLKSSPSQHVSPVAASSRARVSVAAMESVSALAPLQGEGDGQDGEEERVVREAVVVPTMGARTASAPTLTSAGSQRALTPLVDANGGVVVSPFDRGLAKSPETLRRATLLHAASAATDS